MKTKPKAKPTKKGKKMALTHPVFYKSVKRVIEQYRKSKKKK